MSLKSIAGKGAAASAGIVGIALLVIVVVALSAIVGGLVGAGIAAGYNIIFGTAFAVKKFALIGACLFGVAGGASLSGGE